MSDDPMAGRTTAFHYFILPHNRRIKMIRRPLINYTADTNEDVPAYLAEVNAYRQPPFSHLCKSNDMDEQNQECEKVNVVNEQESNPQNGHDDEKK